MELTLAIDKTDQQKDWAGENIGQLTFLRFDHNGGKNGRIAYWQAVCDCGAGRIINIDLAKKLMSCGHDAGAKRTQKAVDARIKFVGQEFYNWKIIDYDKEYRGWNLPLQIQCLVCGFEKWGQAGHIRRGLVRCYGCTFVSSYYDQELPRNTFANGPTARRKLWNRWLLMNQRCDSTNDRYGGRGITVCEEWHFSNPRGYVNYVDWIISAYPDWEDRVNSKQQLDRRDNDGPYSPENCRLITPKDNARNTCRTVIVEYKGEKAPLIEIAEKYSKINPDTVYSRYHQQGWNLEDALNAPVHSKGHKKLPSRVVEFQGEQRFLKELVEELTTLKCATVQARLKKGWTVEEALFTPLTKRVTNR